MKRVSWGAGDGLIVSPTGPGIFLQGLAVHGSAGQLLPGYRLNPEVVRAAFQYATETDTPLCAFLGDDCATLRMHPELQVPLQPCSFFRKHES